MQCRNVFIQNLVSNADTLTNSTSSVVLLNDNSGITTFLTTSQQILMYSLDVEMQNLVYNVHALTSSNQTIP